MDEQEYWMTCALTKSTYQFTLWTPNEHPDQSLPHNGPITYNDPTRIVIKPKRFDGDTEKPRLDPPAWWHITGCRIGLAKLGPRGDTDVSYNPPVATIETQTTGYLVITDYGDDPVDYEFFVQIRVSGAEKNGYPEGSIIIWDPELQNQGGTTVEL